MLVIAIVILIDAPGPIFFAQQRVGQNGRTFWLFKFRKFKSDSDGGGLTLLDDPRLTRVGRLLEATKLDELPQLWNVLTGDMAIVGPRPESMHFADCFKEPFRAVLDHKPGLVGPNQILFRHEKRLLPQGIDSDAFYRRVLFPAKARIDLAYFSRRTLLSDLGWIGRAILLPFGGPLVEPAVLTDNHPVPSVTTTLELASTKEAEQVIENALQRN